MVVMDEESARPRFFGGPVITALVFGGLALSGVLLWQRSGTRGHVEESPGTTTSEAEAVAVPSESSAPAQPAGHGDTGAIPRSGEGLAPVEAREGADESRGAAELQAQTAAPALDAPGTAGVDPV